MIWDGLGRGMRPKHSMDRSTVHGNLMVMGQAGDHTCVRYVVRGRTCCARASTSVRAPCMDGRRLRTTRERERARLIVSCWLVEVHAVHL